jgi:hypothetical protein
MANEADFSSGLVQGLSGSINDMAKMKMQLAMQSKQIEMQQNAEQQRQLAVMQQQHQLSNVPWAQADAGLQSLGMKPEQLSSLEGAFGQTGMQQDMFNQLSANQRQMSGINLKQEYQAKRKSIRGPYIDRQVDPSGRVVTRALDRETGQELWTKTGNMDPKFQGKMREVIAKHAQGDAIIEDWQQQVDRKFTASNFGDLMQQYPTQKLNQVFQNDPEMVAMFGSFDALTTPLVKSLGDVGAITEGDKRAVRDLLPYMTDTLPTAQAKLNTFRNKLQQIMDKQLDAYTVNLDDRGKGKTKEAPGGYDPNAKDPFAHMSLTEKLQMAASQHDHFSKSRDRVRQEQEKASKVRK